MSFSILDLSRPTRIASSESAIRPQGESLPAAWHAYGATTSKTRVKPPMHGAVCYGLRLAMAKPKLGLSLRETPWWAIQALHLQPLFVPSQRLPTWMHYA